MACYYPLKGFVLGHHHETGKLSIKVCSSSVDHLLYDEKGFLKKIYYPPKPEEEGRTITDYVDIPCSKCIGCRLARSADWANRCMLEAQQHEKNCFITLTYNDDNLPDVGHNRVLLHDDFTGKAVVTGDSLVHPLVKKDFQDFMKRFRFKISPDKIRFFACGEYGGKNMRPHYHAIIFGYDFPDKKLWSTNALNQSLYTSELLSELWPYGFHTIGAADWNSCAYVSRYIMKKQLGLSSNLYEVEDYPPEFVLMSRKPGIARDYYEKNTEEIYRYNEICLALPDGSKVFKPPKYFDKLYDIDFPYESMCRKNQNLADAEISKSLILSNTDKDYYDYLKDCEKSFHDKTKILQAKRNKI